MSTTYTPSLRLALPGTGELDGLWGGVVNTQVTSLIEQAITGQTVIATWGASNDHTLTSIDGTVDEARSAVLVVQIGNAPAPSNPLYVFAPAEAKTYIFVNTTLVTANFASVAPGANTLPIAPGHATVIICDGTVSRYGVTFAYDFHSIGLDVVQGSATQTFTSITALSGSITLDSSFANFYVVDNPSNLNLTFTPVATTLPNLPDLVSFIVVLVDPGTGSISWLGNVRWPNNVAPLINSSTYNLFVLTKFASVNLWYGAVLNNYPTV